MHSSTPRSNAASLRVALVFHDRVIEERLVPFGRPVTIGESPRDTFSLVPAGVSGTQPLLRTSAQGWVLRCTEVMRGCVSQGGKRQPISGIACRTAFPQGPRKTEIVLAQDGEHTVRAEVRDVAIEPGDWGVVACGEARIVFQCVVATWRPRRRWLARAWYGRATALLWTTLLSVVVQITVLAAVMMDDPRQTAWAQARSPQNRRLEYVTSDVLERREPPTDAEQTVARAGRATSPIASTEADTPDFRRQGPKKQGLLGAERSTAEGFVGALKHFFSLAREP